MKKSFFERVRFLSGELVLGGLVTVLSVLTGLAAWQGSLADSRESDMNVEGQKQLTESNSMYLEANQFVIYDFSMYDGWYTSSGVNEENAQYYRDNFSDSLNASMERPDGPFDEPYYTEMYADAASVYDGANTYFDLAQEAGDRADNLQFVVLIFAVGLALSAYGSLLDGESRLRLVFAIASIVALIFGLIRSCLKNG